MSIIGSSGENPSHQDELPATSDQQSLQDLLIAIDNISPQELSSKSHANYVRQITTKVEASLAQDPTTLLLLIGSIKECQKSCYKRDLLLEVLNRIVNQEGGLFTELLLCHPFNGLDEKRSLWKELANSISSLPDLIANCQRLDKYPKFKLENYYPTLSGRIYRAIECLCSKNARGGDKDNVDCCSNHSDIIMRDHLLYILQLIGRISISGARKTLWDQLHYKLLANGNKAMLKLFTDIVTIPFDPCNANAIDFAIFIEPLSLLPLHSAVPSQDSGSQIYSFIGSYILHNKSLQYVICNKQLLQTNFHCDNAKQNVILFNIFAYLAHLTKLQSSSSSTASNDYGGSLLIQTLLDIARSWASGTKALLRTYQQNKYITKALVVALRYSLKFDEKNLANHSLELQSTLVKGIPTYLNRASSENRNLAICLAEMMMPLLHRLIDSGSVQSINRDLELKFDVQLNDDCLEMKRLFETEDVGQIFQVPTEATTVSVDSIAETLEDHDDAKPENDNQNAKEKQQKTQDNPRRVDHWSGGVTSSEALHNSSIFGLASKQGDHSSKRDVSETVINKRLDENDDDDEDDLVPYALGEVGGANAGEEEEVSCDEADIIGEEVANVPMYLSDCINGLIEDKSARYVKLCLVKAGELLQQQIKNKLSVGTSKQVFGGQHQSRQINDSFRQAESLSWLATTTKTIVPPTSSNTDNNSIGSSMGDDDSSIRDIANELAQILLYLDDHFNIEGFDSYRMKALDLLCVAAPDLVVKYLLDEFNGPNKNTRHQLDILQLLVSSARQLSSDDYCADDCAQRESIETDLRLDIDGSKSQAKIAKGSAAGESSTATNISKTTIGKTPTKMKSISTRTIATKTSGPKRSNKFVKYASLYFYGIVHKLKAELNSASNVNEPTNIVSAVKSFARASSNIDNNRESMIRRVITGLANSRSQLNGLETDLIHSSMSLGGDSSSNDISSRGFGRGRQISSSCSSSSSSCLPSNRLGSQQKQQQQQRLGIKKLEEEARVQGDNIAADDSYLLSRIFLSLSLIIDCLNQQPITCRLVDDLLDILAAYRYHADMGVRRSILACLKSIRNSTPSVYFNEFLHDKTINLFGSWLAMESELLFL